ncbi:MAG: hypothetical protein GY711_17850 [bacterium]|nr:hypothetical protein [bacterium]
MKTKTHFVPFVLLAPLFIPAAISAPASAVPPEAVDDYADFKNSFMQAMKVNSKDEMARLVKKYQEQAIWWVMEVAEGISNNPNDALFERIAALKTAWKATIRTDFVDEMEKYFSLIEGPEKRERVRFKADFTKKRKIYLDLTGAATKDVPKLTILGNDFEDLAESFRQVGDYYYASQCFIFVGNCNDEQRKGGKADLKKVCAAFSKAIEYRDKIHLKDRVHDETTGIVERLVGLGFGSGSGGAEGAPTPAAVIKSAGAELAVAMGFEAWTDRKVSRPSYYFDDLYQMWNVLVLKGKGSSFKVPRLDPQPTVMRVGPNDVQVDVDNDGKGDVEIPLTGNRELVELEIGDGESKRKWAFEAITGVDKDVFQGDVQVYLAPTDNNMTIYMAAAGSLVGEVEGVPIRVFDDNLDGVYGSNPTPWLHSGLVEGSTHPEMDSILIGSSKRALPWSEHVKIGEKWYRLEVQDGGMTLGATPVEMKTGTLTLDFKGFKPGYVIVKGENDYENSYFDIAGAKKVEVPVGRYTLFFGMISKGKKLQVQKAMILPGEATPKWTVLEGEEIPVELGKPFDIAFSATAADGTVTVEGESVHVVGRGGEQYERLWGCVLKPVASWRKAGTKRGSRPEKMRRLMTHEELGESGWKKGWFPLTVVMERKGDGGVEVMLMDKKNKLFGKLESSWRKAE